MKYLSFLFETFMHPIENLIKNWTKGNKLNRYRNRSAMRASRG